MPLPVWLSVLVGPSQEFARHWLADRNARSLTAAERTLAQAAWDALEAKPRT